MTIPKLRLKNLQFGELNNLKENDSNFSGDRRRTAPLTSLKAAAEKAYEVNTLEGVSEFNGVIVGVRKITYPTYDYIDTLLHNSVSPVDNQTSSTGYRTALNFLYRVYIPEIEPLPAPESYDDPVLMAYKEYPVDIVGHPNIVLNNGDLVRVSFQDASNLASGKIVRKLNALNSTVVWESKKTPPPPPAGTSTTTSTTTGGTTTTPSGTGGTNTSGGGSTGGATPRERRRAEEDLGHLAADNGNGTSTETEPEVPVSNATGAAAARAIIARMGITNPTIHEPQLETGMLSDINHLAKFLRLSPAVIEATKNVEAGKRAKTVKDYTPGRGVGKMHVDGTPKLVRFEVQHYLRYTSPYYNEAPIWEYARFMHPCYGGRQANRGAPASTGRGGAIKYTPRQALKDNCATENCREKIGNPWTKENPNISTKQSETRGEAIIKAMSECKSPDALPIRQRIKTGRPGKKYRPTYSNVPFVSAVEQTSWGLYQVMGFNVLGAPYKDIEGNVTHPYNADRAGMERFIQDWVWADLNRVVELSAKYKIMWYGKNPVAITYAQNKNWLKYAKVYNGCTTCQQYSDKYAAAYATAVGKGFSEEIPPAYTSQEIAAIVSQPGYTAA